MKLLTRMLLINWHYIKYQVIDLARINFLTGKNGAGKSTIIDALQLVLLGDTSGYFFNKAANDKSQRSLKGYLRGEIAEDEQTNTIYLRNDDFSTYIVLEFFDDKSRESFCLGVVFDCFQDGTHDHQFFYLNAKLPANHFIEKGIELNRKGLKAYLYNNYPKGKYEFFETNSRFQDVLLGKLGQINKRFFRLFKKAVPFSPIMDIKGFISEFVCDVENKIDISDMQETIRYYKELEQDLEMVKNKTRILKKIEEQFKAYEEEGQRLTIQNYLVDRGSEEKLQREIIKVMERVTKLAEEIADLDQKLLAKESELSLLNSQRDELYALKINSDIYKKRTELQQRLDDLQKEITYIENTKKELQDFLTSFYLIWREVVQWMNSNFPDVTSLENELQLLAQIKGGEYQLLREENLKEIKESLQSYVNVINDKYFNLSKKYEEVEKEVSLLQKEIKNLELGIKPFPQSLQELINLITDKLTEKNGKKIKPEVFADLLEIKNEKWRNAIEGYLHTQKFYLIIEPEFFTEALQIYDQFKFTHKLYDLGLVDIKKIMEKNYQPLPKNLAEEIETDNVYARVYANYLLGRVIKCEKVEDLRKFRTAITPTCMLYQNYVARQLNPIRYQTPYIGRQAVVQLLKLKRERLAKLSIEKQDLEKLVDKLASLRNVSLWNDDNIKTMLQQKERIMELAEVQNKFSQISRELGELDLSYLTRIEEALKQVEKDIELVQKQLRKLEVNKGKCISEKEEKEKRIPFLKEQIEEKQEYLSSEYSLEWVEKIGEPRFQQELAKRGNPENIIDIFTITVKGTKSRLENKWNNLLSTRITYNRDFGGSLDVQREDNLAYVEELRMLEETLFVEYEAKIKDAQQKAQIQFKEDFISKLKSNIDTAQEQLEDLNKALKDVPFGRDKYRFKVTPNPVYKKYYDMIMDELLLEGFTLFSGTFQEKYQDVVEELFRQIIATDEGVLSADKREELNKNLEKFTDYRTYLDFDLLVTDDEGNESRLSRVITKKSGGETQTPFYISVLASFVQLYRIKQSSNNTARIIVFDEAYSKMDHQRIKESINLIRNLGLQVILSAPTEKIGDIAPLVDRNLCVTRIKKETIIKAFDPRELTDMGA